MQFVEKNSFNVRSSVYLLKSQTSGLEFLLFPMVHIGSKKFYQEVSERLSKCDLVLGEGVNSKKANILTLSYRIVKKIKRMDLTTQHEGLDISKFGSKIFNSDITVKSFDENWSTLSILFRISLFFVVPVYVIYLLIFGTKEIIAANMATEDLPNSNEILFSDANTEKLDTILVDKRDKVLIENIEKLISANENDKKTVAILFGAIHMRNIVEYLLSRKKYQIVDSEWLVVFNL